MIPAPLLLATFVGSAQFSISPKFPYNGVDRPIPIEIRGSTAELSIRLVEPGKDQAIASAKIEPGARDLATAFPQLWSAKSEKVLYAQLYSGSKPVGSALVLQPMLNPPLSKLQADGKTVEFVAQDKCYSGIRAWVDQDILIDTSLGQMRFRMRPDCAPNTVWNIMRLVADGFYRDVIWHRVVAEARGFPFVIQGGDPTGTGDGGPGYSYALEDSALPHDFGVISIARDTDPNTNGSQIFVCLSREGTARLDHKYASFGQCIEGAQTILKIAAVPVGKQDRPLNPPVIRWAKLVDAAPFGTGPQPVKRS